MYLTTRDRDLLKRLADAGEFDPAGTADAEVAAHEAAGNPHSTYLTQAEADALYEDAGAVAAHVAAGDPHPGYLTPAEGNAAYDAIGAATAAVAAHEAASDPHTGYQKESEKGAANGYASLGAGGLVPIAQLASGTPSGTKFVRDDGTLASPGAGAALDAWPVGSVYIAVDNTDPATRFGGGTWAAFGAGRVLVGLDSGDTDFDTGEETGGAKTVSAAGSNSAPTFTGNALGTHAHGAGTLVPSAHSGSAVADHASHTHTYTEVPNHVHVIAAGQGSHQHGMAEGTTDGSGIFADRSNAAAAAAMVTDLATLPEMGTNNPTGGVATGTTAGPSATLSHGVTQPSAHTMAGTSEAVSAGTPAGTVSAPTFTGSPTSVVQPYIVVYMWKRTA